jgi:hypothetical protein
MLARTMLYLYAVAFALSLLLERPETVAIAGP